jgi:hypothetical protein
MKLNPTENHSIMCVKETEEEKKKSIFLISLQHTVKERFLPLPVGTAVSNEKHPTPPVGNRLYKGYVRCPDLHTVPHGPRCSKKGSTFLAPRNFARLILS